MLNCEKGISIYLIKIKKTKEINHGSQNVLGVLTWIGGY
jgi:hypothetical protein